MTVYESGFEIIKGNSPYHKIPLIEELISTFPNVSVETSAEYTEPIVTHVLRHRQVRKTRKHWLLDMLTLKGISRYKDVIESKEIEVQKGYIDYYFSIDIPCNYISEIMTDDVLRIIEKYDFVGDYMFVDAYNYALKHNVLRVCLIPHKSWIDRLYSKDNNGTTT